MVVSEGSEVHLDQFWDVKVGVHQKLTCFREMRHISPYQLMLAGGKLITISDESKNHVESPFIDIHLSENLSRKINPNLIFMVAREAIKWFSKNFNSNFPFEKINLVFIPKYFNVSNSGPGSVILFDERFLQESCDILDKNYFNLILTTQM